VREVDSNRVHFVKRPHKDNQEESLACKPSSTIAELRIQSDLSTIFHISQRIMLWRDVSHFSNSILAKPRLDALSAAAVIRCLHQVWFIYLWTVCTRLQKKKIEFLIFD
jgi:hypothetical protein